MNTWYLYILRCGDGIFYTGIVKDVEHRMAAHRSGKGAKYTKGRCPLEMVYQDECGNHSQGLRREAAVKKLSRDEKQKLADAFVSE